MSDEVSDTKFQILFASVAVINDIQLRLKQRIQNHHHYPTLEWSVDALIHTLKGGEYQNVLRSPENPF